MQIGGITTEKTITKQENCGCYHNCELYEAMLMKINSTVQLHMKFNYAWISRYTNVHNALHKYNNVYHT